MTERQAGERQVDGWSSVSPLYRAQGLGVWQGAWPCVPLTSLPKPHFPCLVNLFPDLSFHSRRPFFLYAPPSHSLAQRTWPESLGLGLRDSQQAGLSWGWGWGWGVRAADQTWSCLFSSCLLCSGSPRGRGAGCLWKNTSS